MFRGDVCTQKKSNLEVNVTLHVSAANLHECKLKNGLLFKYKDE